MEKQSMDKERVRPIRGRGMEFRAKLVEGTGALIFAKDTQRYLFLLRTGGSWPMTWALPGGKRNNNETDVDALSREIEEELGGRILHPDLVKIDSYTSSNGNFKYQTYFVSVDKEFLPFLNNEHAGFAWLPLESAPRPLHPGVVRTLKNPEVMKKIADAGKIS